MACGAAAHHPVGLVMFRFLIERIRHWLTYRPERRYMRGRG